MNQTSAWWQEGVVYQIYPRSFQDSDGDGIGDLPGILEKLDYLANLGVDAIWLSPVYPSPDVDFGYDVSDYCAIDPKFGRMADFDNLVRQAEKRGMRLVMDLVLNHTSDQHAWFIQSRASRTNPYHDWYLWSDAAQGGGPPNNWLSVTGGCGWQWEPARRQYYYHMFYKEQPDFNWRNPNVRREMMDVVRFWLDRGVKGFRLDVFNLYFKDAQLRSNPRKWWGLRPFDRQAHIYDFDQPEMQEILAELRQILDAYEGAYAIGEPFMSTPEKAASYCGEQALHQTFNFHFLGCSWREARFREAIGQWERALGKLNWPNYVLNNHDVPRAASRYGEGEDDVRLKTAATMLLTLRGTPYLYYGEEIGMRDVRLKRQQIQDPVGRYYWPFYRGRDGCRAPMQWDASIHAGFTTGQPWLPLHPNWIQRNAQAQSSQPDSLLACYQKLIALRKQQAVLRRGNLILLHNLPPGVLGYMRELENEQALILLNFTRGEQTIRLDVHPGRWKTLFSTRGSTQSHPVTLQGDEGLILLRVDSA